MTFHSDIQGKGSVSLYDHLGRNIGILLEPEIQIGDQSWVVDPGKISGRELPAGIYFIRIQVGGMGFCVKILKYED